MVKRAGRLSLGRMMGEVVLLMVLCSAPGCGGGGTSAGTGHGGLQPDAPGKVANPNEAGLVTRHLLPPLQGPEGTEAVSGWPELPGADCAGPYSEWKQVSATQRDVAGEDYAAQTGLNNYAVPEEQSYVIVPGGDDPLAYAMYSLAELDLERPVNLSFTVTAAPLAPGGDEELPLSFYLGVSNYSTYSWEWHGPYTSANGVQLNSAELLNRCISAGHVLSIVVATVADAGLAEPGNPQGLTAAKIESHGFTLEPVSSPAYHDTVPHFAMLDQPGKKGVSALDPSQYVTLSWEHVTDPTDNYSNEADTYEIRRQEAGEAISELMTKQNAHAGTNTYTDDGTAPGVAALEPGKTYIYYLRAENESGYSAFDHWEVTIPLLPPQDVAASDGTYDDRIALTWSKAEGASGYLIYRDGQDTAHIAASCDGTAVIWEDLAVSDFLPHTYWIRSTNQYCLTGSAFSAADEGWRCSAPQVSLEATPQAGNIPLLVDFDATATYDPDGGDIQSFDWDFDGDATYDLLDGGATPGYEYESHGQFNVAVRATDDEGDSSIGYLLITANSEPAAALTGAPLFGQFPLDVDFDASGSSDPDGTIADYEWDFDGNGAYNEAGPEAAARGLAQPPAYTYSTEGSYFPSVRVTDDFGATDTASVAIGMRGDWWMFGRDASHTRRSPYLGAQTSNVKWSYDTGATIVSASPVLDGEGTVYITSSNQKLWAIHPNGTYKSSYMTYGYGTGSPAIALDGTLYVDDTNDNKLHALYPDNTLKWASENGAANNYCSPAIASDGTIYTGSQNNKLYATHPDGSFYWSYLTGDDIRNSPAIGADGTVYAASLDGKLYAISPEGDFLWSYQTPNNLYSSPAVAADGTIYVGCRNNFLYAIKPDGNLKWLFSTGSSVDSSPAIGIDGKVYVGASDGKLYSILPNGNPNWSYPTGAAVDSSPAIGADGVIYVGSNDGSMYAIKPDGTLLWSYATGGAIGSSPAIGIDGTVYIGSADGMLYAFGPD